MILKGKINRERTITATLPVSFIHPHPNTHLDRV